MADDWSVEISTKSEEFDGALAELVRLGAFQLTGVSYAEEPFVDGRHVRIVHLAFRYCSVNDLDGEFRKLLPASLREGLCDFDLRLQATARSICP